MPYPRPTELRMSGEPSWIRRKSRSSRRSSGASSRAHPRKKDMSEVYIGEDFLGPIYRETDDGETSWNFQMAILEIDLED